MFQTTANQDAVYQGEDSGQSYRQIGIRVCPASDCRRLVAAIWRTRRGVPSELLACFPPEVLEFDDSGLPSAVKEALEEAVTCHASGCYRAAAAMLRRTVEVLCEDVGAVGTNLYQQLEDLKAKVSIAPELISGAHDIRAFGNDGVHAELKDFDRMDRDIVEVGVDVVKRIVQAAYQDRYVVDRLSAYKARIAPTP